MTSNLKEDFFRLDGAWASFELMAIRKREDYLKPFRVIRCKIDDQVKLEEFDVRLLHHGRTIQDDEDVGAGALVRVLAIFSDGKDTWGTVGVAADILEASVECIIDGLEWKLRGEHKH